MLARVVLTGAVAALFVSSTVAEEKPLAVVAVRSVDSLIESGRYALEASGNGDTVTKIKGLYDQVTGGAPTGIDFTRPFGATAGFSGQPTGLAMIPITDSAAVLAQIAKTPVQLKKLEEGLYEAPAPQPVFVRFTDKWAFVGNSKEGVANAPTDPAAVLNNALGEYQIAQVVDFSSIPQFYKGMANGLIDGAIDAAKRKTEGRDDPGSKGERPGVKVSGDFAKALLEGTDRVTFGVRIDKEKRRFVADLALQAAKGSKLAFGFAELGDGAKRFQGLVRNQPFLFGAVGVKIPQAANEVLTFLVDTAVAAGKEAADKQRDDPLAREALKSLEEVARGVLEAGRIDFGFSAAGAKENVNVVGGIGLTKAQSLARFIEKLSTVDENAKKQIEFNAAQHKGLTIHHQRKSDDAPRSAFDSMDKAFGTTSDAVYFAAGKSGSVEALKSALEMVLAVEPPEAAPLAELRVYAGRADKAMAIDMKGDAQIAFLKHFDRDDRISLKLNSISRGVSLEFETEEGFIRFFAEAIAQGINQK